MKKLLILFGGLAIFAIDFDWLQSLFSGVDEGILFSGYFKSLARFAVFAGEMIFLCAIFIYVLFRMESERRIKVLIGAMPIPVRIVRIFSLPGIRIPQPCTGPSCEGTLIYTTACEPHSLAEADGKVFFPTSSNRCRIDIGALARYRQRLSGEDRLFCAVCGIEYDWRIIHPKNHPLNLYNILMPR